MNFSNFIKTMNRINKIAANNEIMVEDIAVTIKTTSGQTIKAWAEELNYMDNEILEIFTDDSYIFLSYTNIESITI